MGDTARPSIYALIAAAAEKEPDGRKQRSQKSQRAIVGALLELVEEGNLTPSAEQVAERAKVGLRSVFRHFADMDSLYREMSRTLAVAMSDYVPKHFKATDWRDQILEIVDRRAAAFERLMPFLCAAQIQRHRSPVLQAGHARMNKALRQLIIERLPPAQMKDPQAVDAIDLLLSFEAWRRLREDQGLGVGAAKSVLKRAITSMLDLQVKDT